jgi:two-component system, chemotaxis family, sensor kinase CheA
MQPVGTVWSKFPRLVRDLAVACGKQVKFEMEGQETELDKTILEAIRDPLTHMVRNAVDHGIETPEVRTGNGKSGQGRLWLHAFHEGGKVVIEIGDDGGGIDPQRVRDKAVRQGVVSAADAFRMSERELVDLVFKPGFSTAEKVTQFSGRGVGMDVVRTNIERIGGAVDIDSRLGLGAVVRMKIPLTLAIVPALTISSGGERFAIPQVSLLELVHLDGDQAQQRIERIHGAPVFRLRGNLLPLAYLDRELKLPRGPHAGETATIVVLQADDRQFGLVVDAIHDTQEIVVKPLQQQLKGLNVYSGATIMGDGQVALILDVVGLAQRAGVISGAAERGHVEKTIAAAGNAEDRISALLFAGPGGARMAIALDQVSRLEEFPRSAIERLGRRDVVQYRGEILPLAPLWELLDGRDGRDDRDHPSDDGAGVQVVVHRRGGLSIGLAIGQILDIVEETVPHRAAATRPGILFSAVVQGKVTEFLDLDEALRRTALLEGAA